MADIAGISGFSQSGLSGLSGLSGGLGGATAGAATGQGGQSALEQLAGMLAEMLLGSGSGSGGGAGAGAGSSSGAGQAGKSGQSDIDSLLQSLQGGEQKDGSSKGANGTGDQSPKELLTQVLMALFEKVLGGSDSSSGTGEGGGNGSGSGSGSGSPVSGAGGTGGGGTKGLEGLGSGAGLGGAQGAGGGSGSVEDLVNTLMKSLGGGSLDNSIQPTSDGGGQVSQDGKLKELLEMIAQFMDSHPETFNQPSDSSSKGTGGGGGGGAPAGGGGGGAPAPSLGGGGGGGGAPAPSLGGGGGGGAAPAPAPSVGGGGGGGAAPTPSIGGAAPTPGAGSPAGTGSAGSSTPVSFPTASGSPTVVNETIKVGPGEVFDGQGKTFTAGPSLGDGGQGEGQKPIFELAEGATLKNVTFGENAADGVHVRAGNEKAVNVDNVHWTNVGEDALTVKGEGGAKVTNLNITNSSAQGANDKIFQLNADANVTVDNFKAKDFGTFMRTNGGQQGNWNLDLKNVDAENGKFSFVKSDSEGLNLTTSGINLKNVEHPYDKLPGSTNHKEV
ncbi:pectate lyase [Pseudomonas cichorii]|uniref:pectate lyase n=1 Tax=Pseudomonas cichorii TaxID=36746 RepID=UPI001C89B414|nr:pectate lyase [Pseudomonas cichorii]MBX8516385.1 pectate lyase [Pseudomonas cichorii]